MAAGESSDESLVRLALAGDRDAFARLIERHHSVLLAVCRRVSNDPGLAEDAAQETVLQAMLSLDRLRDGARFGPWLLAIAVNVAKRLSQRQSRAQLLAGALLGGIHVTTIGDDAAAEAERREVAAIVREAIANLPDGQRRAIHAFYFAGLSHREAAAALGTQSGSVKARLHKARRRLKDRLQDSFKEEQTMPSRAEDIVEVRVIDVRRREKVDGNDYHVVILEETDGERRLPVWVGPFEGTSIAIHLLGLETPRPLTFTFMASLLRKAGVNVRKVRIEKLEGDTFYATVDLGLGKGQTSVDARPSDAIALALAGGAPIEVRGEVFAMTEKQQEAQAAEEKWHGEGTLGAREIVQEVTSHWRPAQLGPESAKDETE